MGSLKFIEFLIWSSSASLSRSLSGLSQKLLISDQWRAVSFNKCFDDLASLNPGFRETSQALLSLLVVYGFYGASAIKDAGTECVRVSIIGQKRIIAEHLANPVYPDHVWWGLFYDCFYAAHDFIDLMVPLSSHTALIDS